MNFTELFMNLGENTEKLVTYGATMYLYNLGRLISIGIVSFVMIPAWCYIFYKVKQKTKER